MVSAYISIKQTQGGRRLDSINSKAARAAQDDSYINQFIAENKSFILSCAGKQAGRYISESDDEFSVAMYAFFTAITRYNTEQGDFLPFAGLVIKRRLTDYYRTQQRFSNEHSVSPDVFSGNTDDEGEVPSINYEVAGKLTEKPVVTAADEIRTVNGIFSRFGFSFMELSEVSPKASKTKRQCAQAVRAIITSPVMLETLRSTRKLPIKALSSQSGIPVKVLERHRKYIIAATIILTGNFPVLAEYMKYIREGETA